MTENAATSEDTTDRLRFSMASPKRQYALGESVVVDVVIENLDAEPLLIRQYVLLPADDPRNTIKFDIIDDHGRPVERESHTMTGRALIQPWWTIETLEPGQTYSQTFKLAGTYQRKTITDGKISKKTSEQRLWGIGEDPAVLLANEYPAQQKGTFTLRAIYHNAEDGSAWPEEFWDRRKKVWTGKLVSNILEIAVLD